MIITIQKVLYLKFPISKPQSHYAPPVLRNPLNQNASKQDKQSPLNTENPLHTHTHRAFFNLHFCFIF